MSTFQYNGRTFKRESQSVQITGKAYWTKILTPDPGTDRIDPSYSICVVPEDKFLPLLEGIGVTFKDSDSTIPGRYVQPRVYVKKLKENEGSQNKPLLLDKDNRLFTGLVGNGSTVDIRFFAIPDQYGIVNEVRVLDLIEYEPEDGAGADGDLGRVRKQLLGSQEESPEESAAEPQGDAVLDDELPDMIANS